jgi:DNA invertase Pin-like site-specific DNA recombinase
MLVGYARVSTGEQTPQLQIDALHQVGCERIFTEKASGAQRDRPQLAATLDYLRQGDTLVIWKLDRLARSMRQLIETVEELERRNIGLRSLTEQLDTTTPGGRLVFHLFGALAEFERAVIRERTTAGLRAARERGRIGGRPRLLKDKDLTAAKALLADPSITVVEVASRLKVSIATFYRYLPGGRGRLADLSQTNPTTTSP